MNKKSSTKIVKKDAHVYQCIRCNYNYIGTAKIDICPACKHENTIVIRNDFTVEK